MLESQPIISSNVTPRAKQRFWRSFFLSLLTVAIPLNGLSGPGNAFAQKGTAVTKPKSDSGNSGSDQIAQRTSKKSKLPENPFPNRRKAPGLEGGTGWLNTSGEISLNDLRGKIVLIDFWTYCCINCIHVLPDLKYLEKKYSKELVVIGIHSAKFENEKDTENIRRAIQRYEIKHPVINDSNMTLWRKFGTRSWPTMAVIDPEGNYCGSISGEGNRADLDRVISLLIKYHKAKGTLDESPVNFALESAKLKPTPLKFPGKVLADEQGNRLFISDSNHNRIVIATLDGNVMDVVGSGAIGSKNGAYQTASFDHPQGMELVGEKLYVADTENHLIRVIDLENKRVSKLAGTGKQSRVRAPRGSIKTMALNSPWALSHVDGTLYIAMAGPHQIWAHKLGGTSIRVYAGSGREDIINGTLQQSALAQPSAIVSDGKYLYVADSEGSAIRKVSVDPKGGVSTVVGPSDFPSGRSLFEFGDIDGVGGKARLQHPLGVVHHKGTLYIADSYNHKIKKVTLKGENSEIKTLLGDGTRGNRLDPLRLSEPSGLSVARDRLYIADTNNHRILVSDLDGKNVSELKIGGLNPPGPQKADDSNIAYTDPTSKLKTQKVQAGDSLSFKITLNLPEGYKLNTLYPASFRVKSNGAQSLIAADLIGKKQRLDISKAADGMISATVPLAVGSGKANLEFSVSYGYCREGVGGLCKLKSVRWMIPVEVTESATQKAIDLEVK